MTSAAFGFPLLGSSAAGNWFIPDTTQRHPLGAIATVNNPYWGGQDVIYLSNPTTTALPVGACVTWDAANQAVAIPNVAGQGFPVAFAMNAFPSQTGVSYGWFVVGGRYVTVGNAGVAVGVALGISAAGRTGAVTAGKQILNARVVATSTATVVKPNVTVQSGSTILKAPNTDGWFVGLALTGTGIPVATTITAIDQDDRTVTMNNAATISGSASITATYSDGTNFWNTIVMDRPFTQGQIA